VVFSRVDLSFRSRYSRSVGSDDHEQVLGVKPDSLVLVDDFNVRQALCISADFVLALDDEDALGHQYAARFAPGAKVKVQHGGVIPGPPIRFLTVGVVFAERGVGPAAGKVALRPTE